MDNNKIILENLKSITTQRLNIEPDSIQNAIKLVEFRLDKLSKFEKEIKKLK